MKNAYACIAVLAAWCATAFAGDAQLTITEPAMGEIFHFGNDPDPRDYTYGKDTGKDAKFFVPVRVEMTAGALPTKVHVVLERKSSGWRKLFGWSSAKLIEVSSAALAAGLVNIPLDPAKTKDGDYRIKVQTDRGTVSLFNRRMKTWATSKTFKLLAVGPVKSWVPSEFQIVESVSIGFGKIDVVVRKELDSGRFVYCELVDAKSLKVVDFSFVLTHHNYKHSASVYIDKKKLTASGQYFVEFKIRHWRRMWIKPETFYRSRTFTQVQLVDDGSQLIAATEKDDIKRVKSLLDDGHHPNMIPTFATKSPLTVAADLGDEALVTLLLDYGANPNLDLYKTPLIAAVESFTRPANVAVVRKLLKHGADPNQVRSSNSSPLLRATQRSPVQLEVVRMLLVAGADPNYANSYSYTPLDEAFKADDDELIQLLFQNGADPNLRGWRGITPLARAVDSCSLSRMGMLLEMGVDVNLPDEDGMTPLARAVYNDHNVDPAVQLGMVQLLLDSGAKVNQRDHFGKTPLFIASEKRNLAVATLLLEKGADPNLIDQHHVSPLMHSVIDFDLSLQLLLKGSNPNQQDSRGNTPLLKAAEFAQLDVVRLLLQYGADPNYVNKKGRTIVGKEATLFLTTAFSMYTLGEENLIAVLQLLLSKGVVEEQRDDKDVSALLQAVNQGDLDRVRGLLHQGVMPIIPDDPKLWA